MRKAKKGTTELVHLIEETWAETKRGRIIRTKEQAEVVRAINGTLYFLGLFDEVRGENHKIYFMKRYLSLHNNMSQARLSSEYCVCRDSVSAYCAMYLIVFEKNLIAIRKHSADFLQGIEQSDGANPEKNVRFCTENKY